MRPDYKTLECLIEAMEKESTGKDALIDSLNRYIEALEQNLVYKEQTIRELRERLKSHNPKQRRNHEKKR
jgi:wobble nucleotide-excising tRNase